MRVPCQAGIEALSGMHLKCDPPNRIEGAICQLVNEFGVSRVLAVLTTYQYY